jgi:hypothetical protein
MPNWLKVAAGLTLALSLILAVGLRATRVDPLHASQGAGLASVTEVACKTELTILNGIRQVHAKYDYYDGDKLKVFEDRALALLGLPTLDVDRLYVITEDDELRKGTMVLFIGLKADCVTQVFGFPAWLYKEIAPVAQG